MAFSLPFRKKRPTSGKPARETATGQSSGPRKPPRPGAAPLTAAAERPPAGESESGMTEESRLVRFFASSTKWKVPLIGKLPLGRQLRILAMLTTVMLVLALGMLLYDLN